MFGRAMTKNIIRLSLGEAPFADDNNGQLRMNLIQEAGHISELHQLVLL